MNIPNLEGLKLETAEGEWRIAYIGEPDQPADSHTEYYPHFPSTLTPSRRGTYSSPLVFSRFHPSTADQEPRRSARLDSRRLFA